MIEITNGSHEEKIIKFLQKKYPVTVKEIREKLHISNTVALRILKQLQIKGIVQLEPLPGKIYVRLIRHDFSFIGKKRQRKFIKHKSSKKQKTQDYDGIMYS